jgi:hypothetical protein
MKEKIMNYGLQTSIKTEFSSYTNAGTEQEILMISLLQNNAKELLSGCLNGVGLNMFSRFLFPISGSALISGKARFRLTKMYHILNSNPYVRERFQLSYEKSSSLVKRSRITIRDLIGFLALFYREFGQFVSQIHSNAGYRPRFNRFDEMEYPAGDRPYLFPFFQLRDYICRNMKEYLVAAFVHGSIATIDYVKGWSDVDLLIVVNQETVTDPELLFQFRKKVIKSWPFLLHIDPFQHHGYFIFSEIDLNFYPQTYFPFILFDYSKSLFETVPLVFHDRDSSREGKKELMDICRTLQTMSRRRIYSLYIWKLYLHLLMLLPTLYLQFMGEYCYKKFSFEMIRNVFEKSDIELLAWVSHIRNHRWVSDYHIHHLNQQVPMIFSHPTLLSFFSRLMPFRYGREEKKIMSTTLSLADRVLEEIS